MTSSGSWTGRPVVAREPSMGYLLRRLAGPPQEATVTEIQAAALVAIPLGALGLAMWQRHLAVVAQARAEAAVHRNPPARAGADVRRPRCGGAARRLHARRAS